MPTVAQVIFSLEKPYKLSQTEMNAKLDDAYCLHPHLNKNSRNSDGDAVIHAAIRHGQPKALAWYLHKKNVDLSLLSGDEKIPLEKRESPLILAIQHVNYSVCTYEKSKELTSAENDAKKNMSADEIQILADKTECLKLLLNYIYSHNPFKKKYYTDAAYLACYHGALYYLDFYINILHKKTLLIDPSSPFNIDDALSKAINNKNNTDHIVDFLLKKFSGFPFGRNRVHLLTATKHGRLNTLNKLLLYRKDIATDKADLDPNYFQRATMSNALTSALDFFSTHKNEKAKTQQMIHLLLEHGASWRSLDLKFAIDHNDIDNLQMLMEEFKLTDNKYFHFECISPDGFRLNEYALMRYAVLKNNKDAVIYLIKQNVFKQEWEDASKRSLTAYPLSLGDAVVYCSFEIVNLLLKHSNNRLFEDTATIQTLINKITMRNESSEKVSILLYLKILKAHQDNNHALLTQQLESLKNHSQTNYADAIELLNIINQLNIANKEKAKMFFINTTQNNPTASAPDEQDIQLTPEAKRTSIITNPLLTSSAPPLSPPSTVPDNKIYPTLSPLSPPSTAPDNKIYPTVSPLSLPSTAPDNKIYPTVSPLSLPSTAPDNKIYPPLSTARLATPNPTPVAEPGQAPTATTEIEGNSSPHSALHKSPDNKSATFFTAGNNHSPPLQTSHKSLDEKSVMLFTTEKSHSPSLHQPANRLLQPNNLFFDTDLKAIQKTIEKFKTLLMLTVSEEGSDLYENKEDQRLTSRILASEGLGRMIAQHPKLTPQIMKVFSDFANQIERKSLSHTL